MKTLDEVIEILEKVVKHDYVWFDDKTALMKINTLADTLNWLKGYQQHIELDKIRDHLARQNNPLSWDELRTMEGKPVWVEADYFEKGWFLVDASLVDIWVTGYDCAEHQLREEDIGVSWQAYRKERE